MKLIQFKSSLLPYWGKSSEERFKTLQKELDQKMQNYFGPYKSISPHIYESHLHPEIKIEEVEDFYEVYCSIGNVEESEIELSSRNNIITIKGYKREESEKRGPGFTHNVRFFGPFWRDINFEKEIDEDKIKASLNNGQLQIKVPKKDRNQTQKKVIEIESLENEYCTHHRGDDIDLHPVA